MITSKQPKPLLSALVLLGTLNAAPPTVADDVPPPAGVRVMLPTLGVAVDAAGTLEVRQFQFDPQLAQQRWRAMAVAQAGDVMRNSPCRYISLRRLEQAIAGVAPGDLVDKTIHNLAGLQRVQFVFCVPEQQDVVIAGPAGGWLEDDQGRAIGLEDGQPIVRLEDLAVALRQFPPAQPTRPFVGCTINPTAAALDRLRVFQRTIPRTVPVAARSEVARQMVQGTERALGMAEVQVFGIHAATRMAQVMVEADYRMKRIAIGLEPPPIPMPTFMTAIRRPPQGMQRWWFTPHYDCLRLSEDRLALQMVGEGVQLQTENLVAGPGGQLLNPNQKPSAAARTYAKAFTEKYPLIAQKQVVFASLRNMIDLLVIAAYAQSEDFYGQAGWSPDALLDEARVVTQSKSVPRQAPCAAHAIWKGSRLVAPAGGGVSVLPHLALEKAQPATQTDFERQQASAKPHDVEVWWWDAPARR